MANQVRKDGRFAKNPPKEDASFLAHQSCIELFDRSLAALGIELTPRSIEKFFAGRANYWQIVNWRRGRTRPKREVWEYLASKHRGVALEHEGLASTCMRMDDVGVHAPNILAWNARRRS